MIPCCETLEEDATHHCAVETISSDTSGEPVGDSLAPTEGGVACGCGGPDGDSEVFLHTISADDASSPQSDSETASQCNQDVGMCWSGVASWESPSAVSMETSILRGVRGDVLLRRCAHLLKNDGGSADTFRLSRPVDHLDAFISHNWSVSRHRKWLALSLHCNLFIAAVGGFLVAGLLTVATSLGVFPLAAVDSANRKHEGVYCRVLGFLVFNSLLLFGSDVLPRHCVRYPAVFLDKACNIVDQCTEKSAAWRLVLHEVSASGEGTIKSFRVRPGALRVR